MYNEDNKGPAAGGGGGAGCLNPLAQQPPRFLPVEFAHGALRHTKQILAFLL